MNELEKNNQERMRFVEKWANYVISNKDWSKQQAVLINSQLTNAKQIRLSKEEVAGFKEKV